MDYMWVPALNAHGQMPREEDVSKIALARPMKPIDL